MALRPHCLDDVFETPADAEEAFAANLNVKAAFAKARAVFADQEKLLSQSPTICTASPAQAARSAFLEELELQPCYPE